MAITYTWTISTVERTIATGGINTIHWRCANCIAWAQAALDKDSIEANIKVDVDNQKAPTSASGQPWAA